MRRQVKGVISLAMIIVGLETVNIAANRPTENSLVPVTKDDAISRDGGTTMESRVGLVAPQRLPVLDGVSGHDTRLEGRSKGDLIRRADSAIRVGRKRNSSAPFGLASERIDADD